MQHHLSNTPPLLLSEIQFIEEFINNNMLDSIPTHYIKNDHFNVNLLTGLILGSLCELDGTFNFNGIVKLLFGNKKGEIDIQSADEDSLMKFIAYASQLSNYYVSSLLDNSLTIQLLENDVLVDYANIESSTNYYAVWMPFYDTIKHSFKHRMPQIQSMPDTDIKSRGMNSFKLLEDYITKTHYQFDELKTFTQQFPQIVIDLYQFRFSMTKDINRISSHKNTVSLPSQQPYKAGVKIGRNDPCFCGSSKKYKNCCINVPFTMH